MARQTRPPYPAGEKRPWHNCPIVRLSSSARALASARPWRAHWRAPASRSRSRRAMPKSSRRWRRRPALRPSRSMPAIRRRSQACSMRLRPPSAFPRSCFTMPAGACAAPSWRSNRRTRARPSKSRPLVASSSSSRPPNACFRWARARSCSPARRPASRASRFPPSSPWASSPLRGLAQSAARELAPKGIHVAHFVIDGGVRSAARADPADRPDSTLDPDAIAQSYLAVLAQPRSAWSWEIELRPWVETF